MLRQRQADGIPTGSNQQKELLLVKKQAPSKSLFRLILELCFVLAFFYLIYQIKLEREIQKQLYDEIRELSSELDVAQKKTLIVEKPIQTLPAQTISSELNQKVDKLEKDVIEFERIAKLRNKEITRMKNSLIEYALAECQRRFPLNPARILMKTSAGDFEIELAPCHLMPVVTMHFLRQVESGFWNGMTFFRAESHVLQATNQRKDGSRSVDKSQFKRTQSIPFQEYSPEYLHHKYTLGIAGRPGGPDFYINMLENIRIHGPGGQGHNYQGDPEADSCFAKILSGQEVADRIQKLPFRREGGLHILEDPVEIIEMKLLLEV